MKNVTWPVWLYVVMTKSFLKLSCYLTAWCITKTKQKTPVTIVFSKQKITLSNSVKVITYGSAFSFKRAATQIQAVFFFFICSHHHRNTEENRRNTLLLGCGNKSVQMPVIFIQDFSGARFSSRLESNNDALQWRTHKRTSMTQPCYLK